MNPSRALIRTRRAAGVVKRWAFPKPEVAAWQHACRRAEEVDRYTPGTIKLGGYTLWYSDLLTVCPQWHEIFVKQCLFFQTDSQSPRVLDCGANVGLATLYFKKLYPDARVTAFEADPAISSLLTENMRANGAADVEIVNAAVWTTNGLVQFSAEGSDAGAIPTNGNAPPGQMMAVPSTRLRDRLAAEQIDLLKVDIEGAEVEVLEDCVSVLGNVKAMLLDLHEFDAESRSTGHVLDLLKGAGFVCSLDELRPLPFRSPAASPTSPFPGRALCWALLVRAWRQ